MEENGSCRLLQFHTDCTHLWVAFCGKQAWQGGGGHAVQSLDGKGQGGLGGSVREQREENSLLLLPDQCS